MALVPVAPDVQLFVQDLGSGDPVVLVAGFGLDHTTWDRQVRVLTERRARVICMDQRGHGQSDKPLSGYELDAMAEDLAAVMEHCGVADASVVGHSFGGQVAFALASVRPDLVRRLVLVGSNAVRASRAEHFPFGVPPESVLPALLAAEEQDRVASRRSTLASAFAAAPPEDLLRTLLSTSLRLPSWAALACYRSMLESDLTDRIDAVEQPVLQVVGSADPVHSARGALWLNERLHDATLAELEGCGHYPMFEAAPELDQLLLDFVLSG